MTYPGWEKFAPPIAGSTLPQKRSKYHNVPTEIDGHTFPSQREANRYLELKAMRDRGEIHAIAIQVQFTIDVTTPHGVTVTVARYIADFQYLRNGKCVTEDAKGMRTELYRLKKKLVEAQYGIVIHEV